MVDEVIARLRVDEHIEQAAVEHQPRHEPRELGRDERDLYMVPVRGPTRPWCMCGRPPEHKGFGLIRHAG